ncbi:MAG: DUF4845 domain-containing protein [Legionellales bacterium]|nr:DUF4845 domain-containing protein [Legionellales bacterium]
MQKKQQGASLLGLAFFIFLIGFLLFFAVKALPPFYTDLSVTKAFSNLPDHMKEPRTNALPFKDEVTRYLINYFRINNARSIPIANLKFTKKPDNQVSVRLDYQVEEHFFRNIFLVIKFEHEAIVSS